MPSNTFETGLTHSPKVLVKFYRNEQLLSERTCLNYDYAMDYVNSMELWTIYDSPNANLCCDLFLLG